MEDKGWHRGERRGLCSIFYSRFSAAGGAYSGAMEPRLMIYLMPSATDISSLVTCSSGTKTRKPDVGLGVVGINTHTTFSFVFLCTSWCCSLVMKPIE